MLILILILNCCLCFFIISLIHPHIVNENFSLFNDKRWNYLLRSRYYKHSINLLIHITLIKHLRRRPVSLEDTACMITIESLTLFF